MANRSVFPTDIDTFIEHYDIQSSDVDNVKRFQELKLKSVLTTVEQTELENLTIQLRDKIFTPEDFNKLQDCITNLEIFFRDNVEGHINTKKVEIDTAQTDAINTVQSTKDQALIDIENKKQNVISYLDGTDAGQLRNDIGVMGDLTTTNQTSLVNALNEVKTGIPTTADNLQDTVNKVMMTIAERNKLTNIADNATNYSHSATHPASMITEDSNRRFVADAEKIAWNNKLDSSNYNATDVLNKIKTVDGSGSGLDADTIDGLERQLIPEMTQLSSSSFQSTQLKGGMYTNLGDGLLDHDGAQKFTDWWHVIVLQHQGGDGSGAQIIIPYADNTDPNAGIYWRTSFLNFWSGWILMGKVEGNQTNLIDNMIYGSLL